jgi:hypothetical protein
MRKVYVEVKTRLIIQAEENQNINEVLENMDYSFTSTHESAEIIDTEITYWQITDSK